MPTIREQTGDTYERWKEQRAADRARKQAKVDTLITRARACKGLPGLDKVAQDAREMGLWHPVAKTIGQCNARLRGRHFPVLYRNSDGHTVKVFDNSVQDVPAWFNAHTPVQLSEEGWLYAGKA